MNPIKIETARGQLMVTKTTPPQAVRDLVPCYAVSWNPREAACQACPVRVCCVHQLATTTMSEALATLPPEERQAVLSGQDSSNQELAEQIQASPDVISYLLRVRRNEVGYPGVEADGSLTATPPEQEAPPPPAPPVTNDPTPAPTPPVEVPAAAPVPEEPHPALQDGVSITKLGGKKKTSKKAKPPAKKKAPAKKVTPATKATPVKAAKKAPAKKLTAAQIKAKLDSAKSLKTVFKGVAYEAQHVAAGWEWRGGKQKHWSKPLLNPRAVQRAIQGGVQSMSATRFWREVA